VSLLVPMEKVAPAPVRPAYRYKVSKILKIHDADTLTADLDLGFDVHAHITIRLLGWNCKELKEPGGQEALIAAAEILRSAQTIIVETEKDAQTFARWLARIWVSDGKEMRDLGEMLEARGLATRRK
jgi:hypothetical protein